MKINDEKEETVMALARRLVLTGLALCLLVSMLFFLERHRFATLTQLADKYKTDKGSYGPGASAGHFYTEIYECFFHPLRYKARKICEIGVASGASLKMLRDYFPLATIYGIDIKDSSRLDSRRIRTFIADQAERRQLQGFIDKCGNGYDLIIDDGGHSMEQQQVSLGYLFRYLKPGGYYIIEDVHTSLILDDAYYGVEKDGKNTTLAMIENFIRAGRIESRYMTSEEKSLLAATISYCNLFGRERGGSIACILKKK